VSNTVAGSSSLYKHKSKIGLAFRWNPDHQSSTGGGTAIKCGWFGGFKGMQGLQRRGTLGVGALTRGVYGVNEK